MTDPRSTQLPRAASRLTPWLLALGLGPATGCGGVDEEPAPPAAAESPTLPGVEDRRSGGDQTVELPAIAGFEDSGLEPHGAPEEEPEATAPEGPLEEQDLEDEALAFGEEDEEEPSGPWPPPEEPCCPERELLAVPPARAPSFVDVAWLVGAYDVSAGWGLSWTDFDGDGDLDLYVAVHMHYPSVLLVNEGGLFFRAYPRRLGWEVGLDDHMGAWSDYDGDGDLDLFTANGFHRADHLMRNEHPGPFVDVTEAAGITLGEHGRGRSALWGDLDGDGWNDLVVFDLNTPDLLYANRGDGTFAPVHEGSGLANSYGKEGAGCGDLDGDGDLDLYLPLLAGELTNVLLLNRGDGTFVDCSAGSGADLEGASRSCALGDYDGDGDLDLYVARGDSRGDVLLRNRGDATFEDVSAEAGVDVVGPGVRGAGFADLDNDGDLDVYVTCGGSHDGPNLANVLLVNRGDGTFERAPPEAGAEALAPGNSAASAFGDFDGDGWVDIALTNGGGARVISAPQMLLKNRGAPAGEAGAHRWLEVLPSKRSGSTDANGARVEVRLPDGRVLLQEAGGMRIMSQDAPGVHVGLGAHDHAVEVAVRWPDGTSARQQGVPADGKLLLTAGPQARALSSHPSALLGAVPAPDLDAIEARVEARMPRSSWPAPEPGEVAARQDLLLAWALGRELLEGARPSNAGLARWVQEHAEEFRRPSRLWVDQIAAGKFTEFRLPPRLPWQEIREALQGLRDGRDALELVNELGIRAWARVYKADSEFEPNYEIDRDDTTRGYVEIGWMPVEMLRERFGWEVAGKLERTPDGGVRGPRKMREARDVQDPERVWPLLRAFRVRSRQSAIALEPGLFAGALRRRVEAGRLRQAVRRVAGQAAWPPPPGDRTAVEGHLVPVSALAAAARAAGWAEREDVRAGLERCEREARLDAAIRGCALAAVPTEEEVAARVSARAQRWTRPERVQGTLLFFTQAELARDALARLRAGTPVERVIAELDVPPLSDRSARGRAKHFEVVEYDRPQAARMLGDPGADAVLALERGEVSEVITTGEAHHVFVATAHLPEQVWEDASAQARRELARLAAERAADELLGHR